MQRIRLKQTECLTDKQASALAGRQLAANSYERLINYDCDVLKPDGSILLKFRRNVLDPDLVFSAWRNLRDAAVETNNRGLAAGTLEDEGGLPGTRYRRMKKDGTISKTTYANVVNSGTMGFINDSPRNPYCRTTVYSLENQDKFHAAYPFIQAVDRVFAAEMPDRHAAQMMRVKETHPAWIIHNTSFSTITVNKNWQTAVHQDKGDLPEGFGVLCALRAGSPFDGCYLCFPKFKTAVDMNNGDVLLCDVHEWHGNTPFIGIEGLYERISCVFYYRAGIIKCASPEEELAKAQSITEQRMNKGVA